MTGFGWDAWLDLPSSDEAAVYPGSGEEGGLHRFE